MSLEILIVDNNSKDLTETRVKERIINKRSYELKYVFEIKIGLSNARNTGVKGSKHNLIGFLDDDAIPEKTYLVALADALEKYPNVSCFANRVITIPKNIPPWYCLNGKFKMINRGNYNLGNSSRFLNKSDPVPIGSGMLICKNIFKKYGYFDPCLGYDTSKSMLIPGEETEFFTKIIRDEVPIYYIHNAKVYHFPEKNKYELDILCKTYKGIGFMYGRKDALNSNEKKIITWAGFPRSYYKRLILLIIPLLFARFSVNETMKNYYFFQMNKIIGLFKGYKTFR
jgi:GT2 family glycosyltransferase